MTAANAIMLTMSMSGSAECTATYSYLNSSVRPAQGPAMTSPWMERLGLAAPMLAHEDPKFQTQWLSAHTSMYALLPTAT